MRAPHPPANALTTRTHHGICAQPHAIRRHAPPPRLERMPSFSRSLRALPQLVQISDLEMALVRDAVWSAVQEFRLPNESELVDRLYAEFGAQPFTLLLPSNAAAERGNAPLFERGRSVLLDILERFLASESWRSLMLSSSTDSPSPLSPSLPVPQPST